MDLKILESKRLYLRRITENDLTDIYEYLSDDNVTKYLGKKSFIDIKEAYELINKIDKNHYEGRCIRWGIIYKEHNKLIGTIGYDAIHIKNKRADIGYEQLYF